MKWFTREPRRTIDDLGEEHYRVLFYAAPDRDALDDPGLIAT